MNSQIKKMYDLNRLLDVLIIFFTWCFAFYTRFSFKDGDHLVLSLTRYLGHGVVLVFVSFIVLKNAKVYDKNLFYGPIRDILNLIKANAVSFFIFLAIAFFTSESRLSRIVLVQYLLLSSFLLVVTKMYIRGLLFKLPTNLVFVGRSKEIITYFNLIKKRPNFNVINWFDAPSDYSTYNNPSVEFLPDELENNGCDAVIIGFEMKEANLIESYTEKLSHYLIPLMILPDLKYAKIGYTIQNFSGIPILCINQPSANSLGLFLKRVFDFFSCLLGIILISPLLLLIALIVKLTSKGPIFYGQVRMGVDGREFKMWKFRSMIIGEANNQGWTVKNDPRVTKIGRILRSTSLDELPQIWNVIRGDMSLVGPRPERPVFVEKFRKEIPDYMLRHKFKAGITGHAQVNGWRGDTSIEKRIEFDIWYIKNWSFTLDVSILFLTFWKGLVNKNAY